MSDQEIRGLEDDVNATDGVIYLVASNGNKVACERRSAALAGIVQDVLSNDESANEIPMMQVDEATLGLVVEYLEHHKGIQPPSIPCPLPSADLKRHVPAWDANFIALPQQQLYTLSLAANYMNVSSLLDLCCAQIGSQIKDKSIAEIAQYLGTEASFSAEEEAIIRSENKWIDRSPNSS